MTTKGRAILRLEYEGELLTVEQIVAKTGLSRSAVYCRHDGKTFYPPTRKPAQIITAYGISDTARGWAKRLGLSHGAILQRINKGWTAERVVATPRLRERPTYTFKGVTLTLVEWAHRVGIDKGTLYDRVQNQGWTIEAALTVPVANNAERWKRGKVLTRLIEGFHAPSGPAVALPRRSVPPTLQTFADAPPTGPVITKSHLFGKSERSAL